MQELFQSKLSRTITSNRDNAKRVRFVITVFVPVIIFVAVYVYFYRSPQKTIVTVNSVVSTTTAQTQSLLSDKETNDAIERVKKLILVPDEQPIIYLVDDAQGLIAQQAFFTGSDNGDMLLIFQQNAKAIIYSPSRNVVVNAGPITYSGTTQTQNTATQYESLPTNAEASVGESAPQY